MGSTLTRRDFLEGISSLSLLPMLDNGIQSMVNSLSNSTRSDRPNILIIVFDTLTARNMSLYGYPRRTTPNMERFAERATVYHRHHAAGNWTTPGTASVLTGTYPWTHRALHIGEGVDAAKHNLFGSIGSGDYSRLAYTHNPYVDLLLYQFRADIDMYLPMERYGLVDTGFDLQRKLTPNDKLVAYEVLQEVVFRQGGPSSSPFVSWGQALVSLLAKRIAARDYKRQYPRGMPTSFKMVFVLEDAIDGIKTLVADTPRPFLGYFHLMPPHAHYCPHREFVDIFDDGWQPIVKPEHVLTPGHPVEELNHQRRYYDEYVAHTDSEFGRLYDFLVQSGRLEDTIVVVTSDHGEMFERGLYGHSGRLLYEPLLNIPLIISRPGHRERQDVYTATSCVDVMPTLLCYTGQPVPDWCEGQLLPESDNDKGQNQRKIFSLDAKSNSKYGPWVKGSVAMIEGNHKLIYYTGYSGLDQQYELYDLANDPEEIEDLYPTNGSLAAELTAELNQKLREAWTLSS